MSRTCRPRHSKGLWPDSSQHRPPRTHHTGEAPAGSGLPQTTHTAVAVEEKRMENGVTPSLKSTPVEIEMRGKENIVKL